MADDFDRVKARLLLRLPEWLEKAGYLKGARHSGDRYVLNCIIPGHADRTHSAALILAGYKSQKDVKNFPFYICKSAKCPRHEKSLNIFSLCRELTGKDGKETWNYLCDFFGEKVERPQSTPRRHVIQYDERSPEEIAAAEAEFWAMLKSGQTPTANNAAQTLTIALQSPSTAKVGQPPKAAPKPRVSPYLTATLDFSQGEIFARMARILKKDNPTWTDAQIQKRAAWEAEMQFHALRGKAVTPFGG